jgi:ankyrin repeat protein
MSKEIKDFFKNNKKIILIIVLFLFLIAVVFIAFILINIKKNISKNSDGEINGFFHQIPKTSDKFQELREENLRKDDSSDHPPSYDDVLYQETKKSRRESSNSISDLFKSSSKIPIIKNNKSKKLEKISITDKDIKDYKSKRIIPVSGIANIDNLGNTVFHDHGKFRAYTNIDQLMAFAALLNAVNGENYLNRRNLNNEAPIHTSIIYKQENYINFIEKLIICEADINIENKDQENVLHLAIKSNEDLDFIDLLIDNDADINKKNKNGDTPLNLAIQMNNLEAAKFLIEKGADVLIQNSDGDTALHKLIEIEDKYRYITIYKDLLELFINNKDILNIKNNNKETIFHTAVKNGYTEVIQFLMKCSEIDFQAQTNLGDTAFHTALKNKDIVISDFFIEKINNFDIRNDEGDSVLHLAVKNGNFLLTQGIINKGVNINQENNNKETPLDLAYKNNDEVLINFLKKNGGIGENDYNQKILKKDEFPKLIKSFDEEKYIDEKNFHLTSSVEHSNNECC